MTDLHKLLACPFCGGPVSLERCEDTYEREHGNRKWYGVVCRNTINLGGTCAIEQRPSASEDAAIERWNRRAALAEPQERVSVPREELQRIASMQEEDWPGQGAVAAERAEHWFAAFRRKTNAIAAMLAAAEERNEFQRAMDIYPDRLEHHEAKAEEIRTGRRKP